MTENNDAMHMLYIQKQEQLLIENIRNKIDYEMKLHILNDRINSFVEKINEMQQALLAQQDINKQAINSFENSNHEKEQLKNEKEQLRLTIQDLETKNRELQNVAHQVTTKTIELNNMKASYENKIKDLQSELERQSQELEQLYNSTKKTKKVEKVEKIEKIEN